MPSCLTFAVVILSQSLGRSSAVSELSQHCHFIDSCSCRLDNSTEINLHYSDNSVNGKPVFDFYSHRFPAFFQYSPCAALPCGDGAANASVCMDATYVRPGADLGTVSSASFQVSGANISLVYNTASVGQHGPAVTSRVRLVCSRAEERFSLDSNSSTAYNFSLWTPCACAGLCRSPGGPGEGGGVSVGTILILIFSSAMVLYFGIGCLYRRVVYGGSLGELVPHRDLWLSLPPLVKDGYVFFISPCLGNRTEYRTYDKL